MNEFPNLHVPFIPAWCVEITWTEMLELPAQDLDLIWSMFARLNDTQQLRIVDDHYSEVRCIYGDGSLSLAAA